MLGKPPFLVFTSLLLCFIDDAMNRMILFIICNAGRIEHYEEDVNFGKWNIENDLLVSLPLSHLSHDSNNNYDYCHGIPQPRCPLVWNLLKRSDAVLPTIE